MTKTKTATPVHIVQAEPLKLATTPSDLAPFIYFETSANQGFGNGIANITLEALRHRNIDGNIVSDRIVVAHLRMPLSAVLSLKSSIEFILLAAMPAQEGAAN